MEGLTEIMAIVTWRGYCTDKRAMLYRELASPIAELLAHAHVMVASRAYRSWRAGSIAAQLVDGAGRGTPQGLTIRTLEWLASDASSGLAHEHLRMHP